MSTELEYLRGFRATDTTVPAAARDEARAALVARIDAAASAGRAYARIPAAPARPRRPRRRLLAGAFGLAAAAVAAALVVGLGSGGVHPTDATAAQLLRRVAVVAAQQPALRPGQYWYLRSESYQPSSDDARFVRESWRSLDGDGHFVQRQVGGGRSETRPFTGAPSYTFFPQSLAYEQVVELPTDTDALYSQIERGGAIWAEANGRPAGDRTKEMFTIVGDWLRSEVALPPDLRAALYRVAARLPDVELLGDVTDAEGRAGIGVARVDQSLRHELVIDPRTSQLLMERTVSAADDHVVYEATYEQAGAVDGPDARPKP